MNSIRWTALATSLILLQQCAHHRDVRPGADGTHRVVTRGADRPDVEKDAIGQARHFCKEYEKQPAIVSESTAYQGDMDEQTRGVMRRASKTASILGGWNVGGDGNMRRHPVGTAGDAGVLMTEDDAYVSEMTFKCQ